MPGPVPKNPRTRQRTNRTSTHSQLPSEAETAGRDVPPLYERDGGEEWHPMVLQWWDAVWRSPMSAEFLDADMRGGLYLLADLHQVRWTAMSQRSLLEAAKEIRLQEVRFGLSPIDRRRLQWEVARGEEAERKRVVGRKRPKRNGDPRAALKAI